MHFLATIEWGYVASGLMVGTLVGLTGVGGVSLMTPILILIFGISPVAAVGTDLLYAAATKTVGSTVHGAHATIADNPDDAVFPRDDVPRHRSHEPTTALP